MYAVCIVCRCICTHTPFTHTCTAAGMACGLALRTVATACGPVMWCTVGLCSCLLFVSFWFAGHLSLFEEDMDMSKHL